MHVHSLQHVLCMYTHCNMYYACTLTATCIMHVHSLQHVLCMYTHCNMYYACTLTATCIMHVHSLQHVLCMYTHCNMYYACTLTATCIMHVHSQYMYYACTLTATCIMHVHSLQHVLHCMYCYKELYDELHSKTKRTLMNKVGREALHLGITCGYCHICPIAGKCYKYERITKI